MSMSAARHHYGGRIDIIWPKRGMKNQFVFRHCRDNDKNEAWKKKKQLASCRTSSSWLGSSQWESLSHYVAALPSGACSSSQRRPCVAFSCAAARRRRRTARPADGGRQVDYNETRKSRAAARRMLARCRCRACPRLGGAKGDSRLVRRRHRRGSLRLRPVATNNGEQWQPSRARKINRSERRTLTRASSRDPVDCDGDGGGAIQFREALLSSWALVCSAAGFEFSNKFNS